MSTCSGIRGYVLGVRLSILNSTFSKNLLLGGVPAVLLIGAGAEEGPLAEDAARADSGGRCGIG